MPRTIADLPASPEAILNTRSLYAPAEPEDPERTMRFWQGVESSSKVNLPWIAANTLHSRSFGRGGVFSEEGLGNREQLSSIVTLDSLEWYIHQTAPRVADRFAHEVLYRLRNPISGMIGGVIQYQAIDPQSDSALHKVPATSGVFVIPKELDGRIDGLFEGTGRGRPNQQRLNFTFIGNVGTRFAEQLQPNETAVLYGNASTYAASNLGYLIAGTDQKSPVVKIHGNVGELAARAAQSGLVHIDGNAGDFLASEAGYYKRSSQRQTGSEKARPVLIRVDGRAGRGVGHLAFGALDISCGAVNSVGDISDMKGVVHEGPFPPGSPGYRAGKKGRILYKDGERVR